MKITRRKALKIMGSTGLAALVGCSTDLGANTTESVVTGTNGISPKALTTPMPAFKMVCGGAPYTCPSPIPTPIPTRCDTSLGDPDGLVYNQIFVIDYSGNLLFFEHRGGATQDVDLAFDPGNQNWSYLGKGQIIGTGWDVFSQVIYGGDGIFYCVVGVQGALSNPSFPGYNIGDLLWYKYISLDGKYRTNDQFNWANRGLIKTGDFKNLSKIFSDGNGRIFGVVSTPYLGFSIGDLILYNDQRNGNPIQNPGVTIGSAWNNFSSILCGGSSGSGIIIYGVVGIQGFLGFNIGDLLFYVYDPTTNYWSTRKFVGNGWNHFSHLIAAKNLVSNPTNAYTNIYGVLVDDSFGQKAGDWLYYQDSKRDGTFGFNGPAKVTMSKTEGYCFPQSSDIGGSISFYVSTPRLSYTVKFVKLTRKGTYVNSISPFIQNFPDANPVPIDLATNSTWNNSKLLQGKLQGGYSYRCDKVTHVDEQEIYCDYSQSFSIKIPAWKPGFYAAVITDSIGNKSYIPFIINNTSSITGNNGILLIANTNTWCAYNDWGGASGYGGHDLIHPHISAKAINSTGRGSILRPNPRLDPTKDDNSEAPPNPRSHLLGAEIWIYDWFENYCSKSPTFGISPQIKLNLASDQDLHFTTGNLYDRYKIIVLSTHPEYWTRDMFEKLSTFRNSGGSIFYLGGNGVYEMVKYFVPVLPETILGKPILFRNGKKGNVSDRDSYGFKDTVLSTLEGFNRNMLLGCTYYTTSIPNPGEFYTVSNRGNITDAIKSSFDFILSNPSANGLIFSTIGKDQSIYLGHSAAEWEVDKFDDVLKTAPPLNFANNFVCDKFATSNDTGNLADIVFIKSKSTPSFVLTIPAITTGASLVYMTQASNGAPIIRGNISQIVNNALNLCLGVNFTVDLT